MIVTGKRSVKIGTLMLLCFTLFLSCDKHQLTKPGEVSDEARRGDRLAASFPAAEEDFFL